MGDLMALEIPDDPLEAAAFLEQQLALANDKVWSLEDENRELSNKYEMARDNVRVLQRGYKEKIDDLQRKIEDRDARLQEIRQEVQRECEDALRAKDVEIAELTVRINKLKAEKRMSGEQPLTMQQLEECAGDPHAAARARGLSASPAWGLFPGPAMSPIVSWAHADKPPVYHKKEPATEELASERGHSGSQRMSMNGSAHVKLASSSGTAATSASLASMRDTVKGSPASQAYNASRTQEQTREASPEAEEFTVHRAIMSPATSAVPSIAESPEQLERINFPSPSPEPADEQEQAETADLDAAYRIVKERLRASEAGYQAVVRELAEAIDARSDLEVRLTAKQAQVEQLEAQLSTFSPLVHALSREVALALDGAADVASALGAPVHDGQTHVHQELKKTRAEVEQLQKLLAEERCTGSERVASARDALDCVKKRWREEEQTWRTESDELRVRVGELQQRLATRQQSASAEDAEKMARMERKVKKAEEVMAAAERSQEVMAELQKRLQVCERARAELEAKSRERIRVTQEQAEAELQGEVAKGKRVSLSLEESEKKAAEQAKTIHKLQEDVASLRRAGEHHDAVNQQLVVMQTQLDQSEIDMQALQQRLRAVEEDSAHKSVQLGQLRDKYQKASTGLQGMQSTLTSQLDKIDHHLRQEFAARYSVLAKELPKSAVRPAGNAQQQVVPSEEAPELASKLLSASRDKLAAGLAHEEDGADHAQGEAEAGDGAARVCDQSASSSARQYVQQGGMGKILAKSLTSFSRRSSEAGSSACSGDASDCEVLNAPEDGRALNDESNDTCNSSACSWSITPHEAQAAQKGKPLSHADALRTPGQEIRQCPGSSVKGNRRVGAWGPGAPWLGDDNDQEQIAWSSKRTALDLDSFSSLAGLSPMP